MGNINSLSNYTIFPEGFRVFSIVFIHFLLVLGAGVITVAVVIAKRNDVSEAKGKAKRRTGNLDAGTSRTKANKDVTTGVNRTEAGKGEAEVINSTKDRRVKEAVINTTKGCEGKALRINGAEIEEEATIKIIPSKTEEKTAAKSSQAAASDISDEEITVTIPNNVYDENKKTGMVLAFEFSALQGIGRRKEQQDAFGVSSEERFDTDGFFAVLCDGMGGMAEGGMIARETVVKFLGAFPLEEGVSSVNSWIESQSRSVYRRFRGQGGTTLVAVWIKGDQLRFWCAGDSDLFLLREGKLYSLNQRHEYKNELILKSLDGLIPLEAAFSERQAGALLEYIGKENVKCDYSIRPFKLIAGDTLLLCSDGISDTLTLRQIRENISFSEPKSCCVNLEKDILSQRNPNQDNYTAIVVKFNGKNR